MLSAAAEAAGSLAGAGPYGWAFGVGDVALQTVSAAIAAAQQQGDWHMFDVTQTIDRSWLLDLTNGRIVVVHAERRRGGVPVPVEPDGARRVLGLRRPEARLALDWT